LKWGRNEFKNSRISSALYDATDFLTVLEQARRLQLNIKLLRHKSPSSLVKIAVAPALHWLGESRALT